MTSEVQLAIKYNCHQPTKRWDLPFASIYYHSIFPFKCNIAFTHDCFPFNITIQLMNHLSTWTKLSYFRYWGFSTPVEQSYLTTHFKGEAQSGADRRVREPVISSGRGSRGAAISEESNGTSPAWDYSKIISSFLSKRIIGITGFNSQWRGWRRKGIELQIRSKYLEGFYYTYSGNSCTNIYISTSSPSGYPTLPPVGCGLFSICTYVYRCGS